MKESRPKTIDVPLRVMTIADCHGTLHKQELILAYKGEKPDIIFFLGDNYMEDLELCLDFFNEQGMKDVLKVGIVGNHEDKTLLSRPMFRAHIRNIDRTVIYHKGLRIGGFPGCIKYKDEDDIYQLWTNQESEDLLKDFAPVDIFVCHDQPAWERPSLIDAHSGLTGIGKYIQKNNPKVMLHGHLHERYESSVSCRAGLFKKKQETKIFCCYRAESFDLTVERRMDN